MNKIVLGLLAHVDAGKTTLAETLLYTSGMIRKRGRVDHGDSFLDTSETERERGITILSKEARFLYGDREYILLDTPGHADFSSETERTLRVLDYAVMVVSASEGVQSQTDVFWKLLTKEQVPVILFVNKTDLTDGDLTALSASLERLDARILPWDEEHRESVAMLEEEALEEYLETGTLSEATRRRLVRERRWFPCCFGSALRNEGIDSFLDTLSVLTESAEIKNGFAARVYKITRDEKGNRLTHIRMTGGTLRVRDTFPGGPEGSGEEKVTQIRRYNGAKYETAERAEAGDVCALCGPERTYAGEGLGEETEDFHPTLKPVMAYRLCLPPGVEALSFWPKMQQLEEEDPQLHVHYTPRTGDITVSLMGEVQTETLSERIEKRFGIPVAFDSGRVLYRETIARAVVGVGHYEPLRHYAEVHILLEPLPRGSGLEYDVCRSPENTLTPTECRLILTHMKEKEHRGVLTGAPITDMKMTLLGGASHVKHTEGGDFREATYRAIRQGLMKAESVLLEPMYAFDIEIPKTSLGLLMSDLKRRNGTFEISRNGTDTSLLTGRIPAQAMNCYGNTLNAMIKGRGFASFAVDGYEPVAEPEEVLRDIAYNPLADPENTPNSVFCAYGAGEEIPWSQVDAMAHVSLKGREKNGETGSAWAQVVRKEAENEKIEEIMMREFGSIRRREYTEPVVYGDRNVKAAKRKTRRQYYLVDGYNLIFASDRLRAVAREDLGHAREMLENDLINFLHYRDVAVMLIYDGYKQKGNPGERLEKNGLYIAFSHEDETGDALMEKLMAEIGKNYDVRAVTSDGLIQVTAVTSGVLRLPSREFLEQLESVKKEITEKLENGEISGSSQAR